MERHPNYQLSQYDARTRDGYILTIFRLNSRKVPVYRKSPVFLMHGVCISSEEYVRSGPGKSLGLFVFLLDFLVCIIFHAFFLNGKSQPVVFSHLLIIKVLNCIQISFRSHERSFLKFAFLKLL